MLLAVSALLLFLTCWNIIPAPVLLLFPLAVAGPEFSPWFMGAAVLLGILARRSQVALLLCALSFICSAIPSV
ncbi:MAG: alpha/beta hydrolase, partial [Bryobacteraceae bacterium]